VEPFDIEELSLNAWPALGTVLYDGWLLRFSSGYSRRANCVNALYPAAGGQAAGPGLREKVDRCERLYSRRKLPTIFKIVETAEHEGLEAELAGRGYGREYDTAVRTVDLGGFAAEGDGRTRALDGFDEEWIAGFIECAKPAPEHRGILRSILGAIGPSVIAARATDEDGRVVACAFGALERGWLGVFDVMVREDRRGEGLGRSVVTALLQAAKSRGARSSYLQVIRGNSVAEKLYESLGYREHYGYHYRKRALSAD